MKTIGKKKRRSGTQNIRKQSCYPQHKQEEEDQGEELQTRDISKGTKFEKVGVRMNEHM